MEMVNRLELMLNEVFVKNAPYQLPKAFVAWVVKYAWIFALIGAILGGFAFLGLLAALGVVTVIVTAAGSPGLVIFAWLALIVLGIQVILQVMAINPLKAGQKRGWDLLFYSTLISVVFNVFDGTANSNFASLLLNLVFIALGLYILFQVRAGFVKK